MSTPVRSWLDTIKPGYAERFAAAFESLGIEDVSDVEHIDHSVMKSLESELVGKCDAKLLHLQRLRKAIIEGGGSADEQIDEGLADSSAVATLSCSWPPDAIGLAIAAAAATAVHRPREPAAPAAPPPKADPSIALAKLELGPNVALSSDQVVVQQILALRTNSDEGIERSFAFQSPSAQSPSGPLTFFVSMIRGDEYRILLTSSQAFASELPVEGANEGRARYALLFMAAPEPDMQAPSEGSVGAPRFFAFRWELSRQAESGLWLTDKIQPLGETPPGAMPESYLTSVPYLLPMQLKQFMC
jgi:hypothetical protein